MDKWLRRIRGAIGMGLTWGFVWSAAGGVPRWILGVDTDAPFGLIFGVLGILAGTAFSGILTLTEGRRGFEQLSLKRFVGWGAVSGLLLSALFAKIASLGWGDLLAVTPVFVVACAACASGSLVVARRAAARELSDARMS